MAFRHTPPCCRAARVAESKLLTGATALAELLRASFGPRARAVLVAGSPGVPRLCERGVTIARQLELRDEVEQRGARLLGQAAIQTDEAVGDGTTTATLIAHALFVAGLRHVAAGARATELERSWLHGARLASAALDRLARVSADSRRAKVVPGAGVALLRAAAAIDVAAAADCDDRRAGLDMLARALELPTRLIAGSCGHDPARVVEWVRAAHGWFGFDPVTGAYGDLLASGVVDALDVVCVALDNAVAVAASLVAEAAAEHRT